MSHLQPCPECERHVRASDAKCPFCGATVDARPAPPRRSGRLSRAAAFAGAALLGVACGGSEEEVTTDETVDTTDTGGGEVTDTGGGDVTDTGGGDVTDTTDDEQHIAPMPYGAPPRRDRLV